MSSGTIDVFSLRDFVVEEYERFRLVPKSRRSEPMARGFQDRTLDWEPIEGRVALDAHGVAHCDYCTTYRLRVPGGWLVKALAREGVARAFVPDPDGHWQPVAPVALSGSKA